MALKALLLKKELDGKRSALAKLEERTAEFETRTADLKKAMTMPVNTEQEKAAKISMVKGLYQELGVGKDAQYAILSLNSKALESASKVCDKARFDVLRYFAEKLIGRTK